MTDLATLTVAEADCLTDCEETISHGLITFVEVGQALITIRDNRLYRATHQTFEEYTRERWNLSGTRTYELIDGAHIHELISSATAETPVAPANERQARPLAKLLPHPMAEPEDKAAAEEEIRETWAEAVQTAPVAPDGTPKVTAKHVEETVARRLADEPALAPAERKPPARKPLPDAFQKAALDLAKIAERLDRLAGDDRFPRNAEQVARMSRSDLLRAVDLLATVIDRLPPTAKES
ncbi:MAG: hypothetical protein WA890_21710 [Micromonospora sp.]